LIVSVGIGPTGNHFGAASVARKISLLRLPIPRTALRVLSGMQFRLVEQESVASNRRSG
jgi:hypothetical protein